VGCASGGCCHWVVLSQRERAIIIKYVTAISKM
jgi:hypothetical protein